MFLRSARGDTVCNNQRWAALIVLKSGNSNSANFLAGPNSLFAKALKYSKSIKAKIMHYPPPPHNGRIVKGADCRLQHSFHLTDGYIQGVRKRCRLSWLTKTFLIYKEIHMGSGAKSYMRKCANFSPCMRTPLVIYDFAPDPSEFPDL